MSPWRHVNIVNVWIFDSPDCTTRLLRSGEVLSGGPTRIRYHRVTFNVSMGDTVDGMSCELISMGSAASV